MQHAAALFIKGEKMFEFLSFLSQFGNWILGLVTFFQSLTGFFNGITPQ
jgi:hypothetical protein